MEELAPKLGPQVKKMADDIDKPNVMTVAKDGKTMTTNKAKDSKSTPAMTFTKDAPAQ